MQYSMSLSRIHSKILQKKLSMLEFNLDDNELNEECLQ